MNFVYPKLIDHVIFEHEIFHKDFIACYVAFNILYVYNISCKKSVYLFVWEHNAAFTCQTNVVSCWQTQIGVCEWHNNLLANCWQQIELISILPNSVPTCCRVVHTHQFEFVNASWPTLVWRVKAALDLTKICWFCRTKWRMFFWRVWICWGYSKNFLRSKIFKECPANFFVKKGSQGKRCANFFKFSRQKTCYIEEEKLSHLFINLMIFT